MTLIERLKDFGRPDSEAELTDTLSKLAQHFIYGGYINVYGKYRIYIRTVEFYFHDETDAPGAIKDPIMYHRNGKSASGTMAYLPLLSLNTHTSGIDITFENEEQHYRAAALIREFSVYDTAKNEFLKLKDGTRDDRSTLIYDYLNGFPIDGSATITWVDSPSESRTPLIQKARKNVFVYKDGVKTSTPDKRQWSFSMPE